MGRSRSVVSRLARAACGWVYAVGKGVVCVLRGNGLEPSKGVRAFREAASRIAVILRIRKAAVIQPNDPMGGMVCHVYHGPGLRGRLWHCWQGTAEILQYPQFKEKHFRVLIEIEGADFVRCFGEGNEGHEISKCHADITLKEISKEEMAVEELSRRIFDQKMRLLFR